MSPKDKVAVVTGSNKGIGFAIVKGLCQKFDGVVYLTSRNDERGKEAVDILNKQSCYPLYHQLDVADKESVRKFRDYIKSRHSGIDILINNAGVSGIFDNSYEGNKSVIDINYRGVLTVEEYLFPLLTDGARVVNVSSDCGHLSNIRNKRWIDILLKNNLTRADIEQFIDWYLTSVKNGTFNRKDFADNGSIAAYRVSKVALCALTMIQQKELESRGICVNSMHPGLVRTDMSFQIGFLTPDEAATTAIYIVLDAPKSLKGKYVWYNREEIDWYDYNAIYYFRASSMGTTLVKNVLRYPIYRILYILRSPSLWVGVFSFGMILLIAKFNNDIVKATGF